MFSHVCIGIADFDRALGFYSRLLPELGLVLKFSEPQHHFAGWVAPGTPRPLFFITRPFNGEPASAGNGQMVALLAPSRAAVDRVHGLALSLGATNEGAPGLRPHYHADYYGGYFRDLDGNKLCICCHDPA